MKSVRRPAALVLVSAVLTALLAGCAGFDSAPGTGPTWSVIPEGPLSARRSPVAAWVAERFVVVGGWSDAMCPTNADCAWPNGAPLQDAAAFDPATGRWQRVAAAPMGVAAASTAVLGDALYVLTADLGLDEAPRSLLKFTPDDDLWTPLPLPPGEPSQLLAAGTVLVAVTDSDERMTAIDSVFDPATQAWSTLPDDPLGPSFDRQAVWIGDRVLLTAKDLVPSPGSEEPSVVRLAELDEDMTTWEAPRDTEVIGWGPVAVNGRVVYPGTGSADGGEVNNWGRSYPQGGIYNPTDGSWRPLPVFGGAVGYPTTLSSIAVGDHVIVGDGLLDPVSGEWNPLPEPPWGEVYEQAVASNQDSVFVWGGATIDRNVADGYLLRP